ncbi:MAG: hypothetical protein PUI46_04475 [Lachnospiraceae bacterium]|nr:hypothetical protein [Lachnospiraceae bacterium]
MKCLVLIAAALTLIGAAVVVAYRFLGQPSEKQVAKIKEWLIWACIEAERGLQSGTGQLKLREVWNLFCAVPAFGWVARIISFDTFSGWVTEALSTVKRMLVENHRLASYVYGDKAIDEVAKLWEQLKGGRG